MDYPTIPFEDVFVVCKLFFFLFLKDMHPDEFVPYLEYKPALRKYQWIGAGRDSDNLLMPLCTYWLERRDEAAEMQSRENKKRQDQFNSERDLDNIYVDDDEMGAILPVDPSNDYSDRVESPLPSCNPTDWVVVPTTLEEKLEFRSQVSFYLKNKSIMCRL